LKFEQKRAFGSNELGVIFDAGNVPENLWISPKIRIFGEISKEKILQII